MTQKSFYDLREENPIDRVELGEDQWIVEFENLKEDDIIEVLDDENNVIDELEILEKLSMKDMSRAVSRYGAAKQAQYRAQGGGTRKDKGMKAFAAQLKGRAKSAANVVTLGKAYKRDIDKGKSNFSRSFSGSIDNMKRAQARRKKS